MATLLFATIPIRAHTTNAAPLAARLLDAGHEVLWYAGRSFHPWLRELGAIPVAFEEADDEEVGDASRPWSAVAQLDGIRAVRTAYREFFVGQALHRARDLRRLLTRHPVDALLTDTLTYGAGLAAEEAGLPWATFGDVPLAFPDEDTPPFGSGLLPLPGLAGRNRNWVVSLVVRRVLFAGPQRHYEQARAELGLASSSRSIFEANLSPYLHLQGATCGFEYPRRHLPPTVHWVGPFRPDTPRQWTPPPWWPQVAEAKRPVVLVSQGSIRSDVTELLAPTVRALADLPVTVVVTTGAADPQALVAALGGALPGNVRVTRFLPYGVVLPHVDLFVTNGGYTGVTLALANGVPLVQAGTTEEKADIGARIQWSGVGVRLGTSRPTPRAVRAAVQRVLGEPSFRQAAQRLEAEMAGHDAGREGADLLLRLAATRRPVLREVPVGDPLGP